VYGFRSSEVRGLTLDDIDWIRSGFIHHDPNSAKSGSTRWSGRLVSHPAVPHDSSALRLAYGIRHAEAAASAAIRRGLSTMVRVRQQRLGQTLHRYGPHGLRHAGATYLLAEGFTLKQIGDHLGHTMVRATEIYAKVDITSLREVGDVDMAALVEHERRCAARSTPFFEEGDLNALREVAHVALGGVQ